MSCDALIDERGLFFKGITNITETGKACKPWPKPDNAGVEPGENYCRNGKWKADGLNVKIRKRAKPWCEIVPVGRV